MSKKLDPRVIRTRQLLRDALVALIVERGFEEITVRDVTDKATLNHATFYLHYYNKEDLLNNTLDAMFEEFAHVAPPPSSATLRDITSPIRASALMFEHFAKHAAFYRVILGAKGVPAYSARLRDYLADLLYQRLSTFNPQVSVIVSPSFAAQYLAGAYLSVIVWWLNGDMPMTADALAEQFIALTAVGTYRAIGLPLPETQWNAASTLA
jgi:AcrR family transcriptional regulator